MLKSEVIDEIIGKLPVNGSSNQLQVLFQHNSPIEITVHQWAELSLSTGMAVTAELLSQLQRVAKESEAAEAAFRFLRLRPRTEQEVEHHLEQKGYEPEIRIAVRQQLKSSGFLNDEAYAQLFAKEKAEQHSRMELSWRLRQKGIDSTTIERVLEEELDDETQLATAVRLGKKQWQKHRQKDRELRRVKVAQFLQRKGFSMEVIYRVIHKLDENMLTDERS